MNALKDYKDCQAPAPAEADVLEWVAFCAGATRLIDYQASPSAGVTSAVAQSIVQVCRRFHPETQPRLLMHSTYLFWRTENTETRASWAMMRVVPVPLPETERRDFDYLALLLTDTQLSALGGDPFALVRGNLHDAAMENFRQNTQSPLRFSVPAQNGGTPDFLPGAAGEPKAGLIPWSAESLTDLERDCAFRAAQGEVPLTFATWWLGDQNDPLSLFEVVLTQAEGSPAEATDNAKQAVRLSAGLLGVIGGEETATTPDEAVTLSRQIAHSIHEAQWTQTQNRDDSPWAACMAQAANDSLSLAAILHHRAEKATGNDATTHDAAIRLAEAYIALSDAVRREQHPRTGRTVTTALARSDAPPAGRQKGSPAVRRYAGVILMLLLTALLSSVTTIWVMRQIERRVAVPPAKKSQGNHEPNTKSH